MKKQNNYGPSPNDKRSDKVGYKDLVHSGEAEKEKRLREKERSEDPGESRVLLYRLPGRNAIPLGQKLAIGLPAEWSSRN